MRDKIVVDLGLKERIRFELALELDGKTGNMSNHIRDLIRDYSDRVLNQAYHAKDSSDNTQALRYMDSRDSPIMNYCVSSDRPGLKLEESYEEYLKRMEKKITRWADPYRKKPIPFYILRAFLIAQRISGTETPEKRSVSELFIKEYQYAYLETEAGGHSYRTGSIDDALADIFIHNLAQMKRPGKQSHGKIFIEKGRTLELEPDIRDFVMQNKDGFLADIE